ncbi:helicase-associated domain-containing protein [Ornithinicoccus hortensis]|uniref:XPB/Ssl2-like helicase family protein n=1 Tax=Ornithinicoccus hortensis TaxID=82346 RepID=A0A542YLV5_9MICO|nr:helicase-associated domain-containing protein [Ornithinicoccus hortensis]TQL49070.1 XPB/Ssl2-like helicase family protein [Ornithinicoccus hortensis]
MPAPHNVGAWLDSRTDEQLQFLLEARPDLRRGAPLLGLEDLARRLESPWSVSTILMELPSPAVEVMEAVTALDTRASLPRLSALLNDGGRDGDEHRRAVLHWLHVLESLGLVWPTDDGWTPNVAAHQVLINPLLLGPPVSVLAQGLTVAGLTRLYSAFGASPPTRKAELLAGLDALYADPSRIRQQVALAPPPVVDSLTREVDRLARASASGVRSLVKDDEPWTPEAQRRFGEEVRMNQWAVDAGLAFTEGGSTYSYSYAPVRYPAEVLLALAPPSYRAPFHPEPPPLQTAAVSEARTERDSAAAVTAALAAQMAVLEQTLRTPLKLLKSGGVGARELTRVAKAVGVGTAEARLALELGASLRFYDLGPDLRAGEEFEAWRSGSPAERATDLLLTWWRETAPPTRERDDDGKARPALLRQDGAGLPPAVLVTRPLAGLEDDAAVTGPEPVLDQIAWAHPLTAFDPQDLRCAWDEAALFGVIRDGRLTRLGRALLTGDRETVRAVLEDLLPGESREVLFGSDLTVVVPGSPGAAVVDLLDTVAVRESHGVGATWRVSEASVREALDRGYPVDVLLAELREVAGGPLPQPLEYLLRDVERRHGRVGVRPAACVVVSEDESLVAELAATKVLRSLGLTAVAPTVLVAAQDVPTTLAALRKAGYLPVEQDAGGARMVEVRSRGPVAERGPEPTGTEAPSPDESDTPPPGDEDGTGHPSEADFAALLESVTGPTHPPGAPRRPSYRREEPAELVARLRAGDPPPHAVVDPGVLSQVEGWSRQLSPEEVRHLATAVAAGDDVLIRYRNENGNETHRRVSGLQVSGGYLTGYCHLRKDDRYFRLDRILSVVPLR